MFKIDVSLVYKEGDPGKGISSEQLIRYSIPEFGLQESVDYKLFSRVKEGSCNESIKFGENHVKPDWTDERFSRLLDKKYESSILQLFLDMVFMPTFLLGDPEKRIAIEYDTFVSFIQKAIDAYAATIKPPAPKRKWLFRYLFGESKNDVEAVKTAKLKKEKVLKCVASFLADDAQHSGICSRNPGGSSDEYEPWNCIVPAL